MGRGRNGGNRRGRISAAQTAYTPARKLDAAGIKELARLKPEVASEIKRFMKDHKTRRVSFVNHGANYELYMAEGADLTFYAPNGNVRSEGMITESTIGAANTGFNYAVNQRTPPLPEGTWVVEKNLSLGQWYATVHYIGTPRLGG
jgi:hypothetical protein